MLVLQKSTSCAVCLFHWGPLPSLGWVLAIRPAQMLMNRCSYKNSCLPPWLSLIFKSLHKLLAKSPPRSTYSFLTYFPWCAVAWVPTPTHLWHQQPLYTWKDLPYMMAEPPYCCFVHPNALDYPQLRWNYNPQIERPLVRLQSSCLDL